jgi:anti-sigma factor RsiW
MECERLAPLLSAHLDGELDRAEDGVVHRHLSPDGDGCPRCAARLRALGAARDAMRATRPAASGPGLDGGLDRIWERIRREREAPAPVVPLPRNEPRNEPPNESRSKSKPGRRRVAGLAAGLAAALLLAVLLAPVLAPDGAERPGAEAPAAGAPAPPAASADEGAPACLNPEECGADAPVLWPAVPI